VNIIISCLPGLFTGIFLFFFQHSIEKRAKNEEQRDKIRNNYIKLIVDLTLATHALSEANAKACAGNNTEIAKALEYANEIKHKHRDFLAQSGINSIF